MALSFLNKKVNLSPTFKSALITLFILNKFTTDTVIPDLVITGSTIPLTEYSVLEGLHVILISFKTLSYAIGLQNPAFNTVSY